MSDLDLIPLSYRRRRRTRRWLGLFAVGYVSLIVCLVVAKWFLAYGIAVRSAGLERLEANRARVEERATRIEELQERKTVLEHEANTLKALRSGIEPREVFVAVDRALSPDVWFLHWTFRQAGEFVDAEPRTVDTGYFITVPAGESSSTRRGWRMETHMEIKAQASDHSALADFVRRLNAQPVIEEVKVLSTHVRAHGSTQIVDFMLAVLIRG